MPNAILPPHIAEAMVHLPRNIPRLLPVNWVMDEPDVEYLMHGILPKRGVAAIYGPSKSGKSFLAMHIVFSFACGSSSCFSVPIKPASVAYLALEGKGGIKRRIRAWQQHNGVQLGREVRIFSDAFRLDDGDDLEDLAQEVVSTLGLGCVVVVDTLAQAMAGYDENTSSEMGAAISGAQRLSDAIEGLVLLVHHTGKDPTKGMRGHSSLLGALDAAIEVKAKGAARTWRVDKAKDGEEGQQFDFELVSYTVGMDADGQAITSCAVRQTVHSPSASLPPIKGAHRIAVMSKLMGLLAGGLSLTIDAAAAAVAQDVAVPSGRQATVAKATIATLVVTGHLIRSGDTILLPP